MEETVSLEPQDAQPAPEPTSRKDSKGYKVAKTAVTFSLLGIIVLCVLISLLCYIGVPAGITENGLLYKDTNVFKFAFDKEGGLLNIMQELFKAFERSSSSIQVLMSIMSQLYLVLGLFAGVLTVLIMSVIIIIKTIIHAVKKDTKNLTLDLISVVKMNLTGIMLIKLFTYVYDGVVTFNVGGGLIASLVISLVVLLAIAVLNFIFFRKEIHSKNKYKQILRSFSTCLLQLIVFAILASVTYYLCFSYFFSYIIVVGGSSIPVKYILSVYFNVAVFVLAIVIMSRVTKALTNSLKYICTLSDTEEAYTGKASSGFIGSFVMTVICFIAMVVADTYAGVGFVTFIVAAIFAACGEVCYILFDKADFFKEEVPATVPEATPAAESNAPSDDNTTNS